MGVIILKVLSKVDKIEVNKSPLSYIRTTARNHCIDEFRREKRRRIIPRRDKPSAYLYELEIDACLGEIYGPHEPVIRLRFLEGKTVPEIVKALGLTKKTVRYQIQTAYMRCKEYLNGS